MANVARMAAMAIVTINSTRVNPAARSTGK